MMKDIRAYLGSSYVNSDETQIDTNSLDLDPFLVDTWDPVGTTMMKIAAFGDSNFDPWAAGFLNSEDAKTPNGLPVIYFEKHPVLTSFDVSVSLSEMIEDVQIRRDWAKITNNQIVQWQNELRRIRYDTGYTDSALKNQTSIDAYWQRDTPERILNFGDVSQTRAKDLAKRHLAQWRTSQYNLSSPIQIREYPRGKGGNIIPASEIRGGMRRQVLAKRMGYSPWTTRQGR